MNQNKKKTKKKWLLWVLLGLAVVAVVIFALIQKKKADAAIEVYTDKVERQNIFETVGASGKIYPITEVKISSDISGEVVELYVEEGDSVVQGQVLAKIDPDAFISQVERAEAALNNAKANASMSEAGLQTSIAQKEQIAANLKNTEKIHERNITLFNEGVISQADFDASLAALEAQKANLRSAEANIQSSKKSVEGARFSIKSAEASLRELQTSLSRTTIKAPMSGIISNLSIELGERVVGTIQMSGTEMMRIANLNAMEVQVDVSENDILRVEMRDSVEIEVDAYFDKKFYGHVTQIANSASNTGQLATASDQVTNFIVKVGIDQNSYADLIKADRPFPFRPGMSAAVEIFTEKKDNILAVPIQAVTTREKNDKKDIGSKEKDDFDEEIDYDDINEVVFVVQADTTEKRVVKTGIQDDQYIHILSGLEEGETIVTGPYSLVSKKLKQGDRVEEKDQSSDDDQDD